MFNLSSPQDKVRLFILNNAYSGQTQNLHKRYIYIYITLPARMIAENIIPRNVIINQGAAEVDNHISRDDIFDYHPSRKCNIYFIIPNRTKYPLFSEEETTSLTQ